MSSAHNIRNKVFGAQESSPGSTRSPTPSVSQQSDSPSLSIHIPSSANSQQDKKPQLPKISNGGILKASNSGRSREEETFQNRLLKKLGTRYDGCERYRLEEDEKKLNHWKRWGSYLSDRQWVGVGLSLYALCYIEILSLGHCT